MKVYNVMFVPYGELRYETNPTIYGTFIDKKKAIECALDQLKKDSKEPYNFVVTNEGDDFYQAWEDFIYNYTCYYEILIVENEVK